MGSSSGTGDRVWPPQFLGDSPQRGRPSRRAWRGRTPEHRANTLAVAVAIIATLVAVDTTLGGGALGAINPLGAPSKVFPPPRPALPDAAEIAKHAEPRAGGPDPSSDYISGLPTSQPAPPGGVAFTVDAFNRTPIPGAFQPDYGAFDIQSALYDPSSNQVYLGASGGDVLVMNGTTGLGIERISTPGGVTCLALDPRSGELWTAGSPWIVSAINLSSGAVTNQLNVSNGPMSIAYDSVDNRIYVASVYNASLSEIDPGNHTLASQPTSLSFSPTALLYDPNGDRLFVGESSGRVGVVNGSNGRFTSTSWPVGSTPDSMAIDPTHNWLFVANGGSDNVTVINLTSGRVLVGGIPTGSHPSSLLYYPLTGSMLVGNLFSENVTEISSSGSLPGMNITSISGGGGPLVSNPTTGRVYTDESTPGSFPTAYLAVLDPAVSNSRLASIQISFDFVASTFDQASGLIYLVNPTGQNGTGNPGRFPPYPPGNSSVMALNGTSHRLMPWSYPVGYGATAISYDPSNRELYVANEGGNSVSVVSPATGRVTTIGLGLNSSPDAIAVSQRANFVYVANSGTNNVTVINASRASIAFAAPVGVAPDAMVFDPANNRLYVANCGSNNLTVLNGSSGRPIASIAVGVCPDALTISPLSGVLFVANAGSASGSYSNITEVNASSNTAIGSVSVGFGADGVAYDSANGYLYVANGYSYNVTVINATTLMKLGPGIPVGQGGAEAYPTAISYDPATAEVVVPTAYSSGVYVLGNVPPARLSSGLASKEEVGVSLVLNTTVTNGFPLFSYQYFGLPAGCSSSDSPILLCIPASPGTFNVSVVVTDARNYTSTDRLPLQVQPELEVRAPALAPNPVEAGRTLSLLGVVTGGIAPMLLQWSGLPSGCIGTNALSFTCIPEASGAYAITLGVTDARGEHRGNTSPLQVASNLTLGLEWATPTTIPTNTTSTLLASVNGGLPPYSYRYGGLPTGCSPNNSPILTCWPQAAGYYQISVQVTDSVGATVGATTNLTVVEAQPFTPAILGFYADPSTVYVGSGTTLVVILAGSVSGTSYSYSGLPAGCPNENTSRLLCVPESPGTFVVDLAVQSPGAPVRHASVNVTAISVPGAEPIQELGTGVLTWVLGATAIVAAVIGAALGALAVRYWGRVPRRDPPG